MRRRALTILATYAHLECDNGLPPVPALLLDTEYWCKDWDGTRRVAKRLLAREAPEYHGGLPALVSKRDLFKPLGLGSARLAFDVEGLHLRFIANIGLAGGFDAAGWRAYLAQYLGALWDAPVAGYELHLVQPRVLICEWEGWYAAHIGQATALARERAAKEATLQARDEWVARARARYSRVVAKLRAAGLDGWGLEAATQRARVIEGSSVADCGEEIHASADEWAWLIASTQDPERYLVLSRPDWQGLEGEPREARE